jgi:AraC-like DNA-binding protein
MWSVRTLLPVDVDSSEESPRVVLVKAAVAQVERHYAEKLRQKSVAASCGMTCCRFSRAFKAAYGLTFSDYLLRFRIARACRLLRQGSHNATSAGLAVGFEDPSHFARTFRKLLGTSPSSYQRQKPPLSSMHLERRRQRSTDRARESQSMSPRTPRVAMLHQKTHPVGSDSGTSW